MAILYRNLEATVAHLPGTRLAVAREARGVYVRAAALFAPHNHPGRHELEVGHGTVDTLVSLTGPAPWAVEAGRSPDAEGKGGMRGLHILGRAAGV